MKNFKISLIPALSLIFGLGLMSGSFAQRIAEASRADQVPAIRLNNVEKFKGQYIHALYAVRRAGFIGGISPMPHLEKDYPSQVQLVQGDNVIFPSISVTKEPFRGSYNTVVFVVSPVDHIEWFNSEEGISNQYRYLQKIDRNVIESFVSQNGIESVLNFTL